MSDLFVDPQPARTEIEGLRTATDWAYSVAALPAVDVGNGDGTDMLGRLAAAVGAFPASFMAQISLLAMAMDLGVDDAVRADQAVIPINGPR